MAWGNSRNREKHYKEFVGKRCRFGNLTGKLNWMEDEGWCGFQSDTGVETDVVRFVQLTFPEKKREKDGTHKPKK